MQVDFLSLACLRDELDALLGARVQRVLLLDEHSIGLELYGGRRVYVLASADPQAARLLLVPERLRRGLDRETPLLLLLRKWVRGARLVDVTQPPWERILMLHFDGPAGSCRLVAEVMGRYSNVVLVGPEGQVLEAVKHIGPELSRYSVTLPGRPYQLPPLPPHQRPPTRVTAEEWAIFLAQAAPNEPLRKVLVRRLVAVGPTVAREVAMRLGGDPEAPAQGIDPQALVTAIAALFRPLDDGSWAPHVALDEDGAVQGFTPYRPQQFSHIEPVASIGEAMWRYFQQPSVVDSYSVFRRQVQQLVDAARARVERTQAQLQGQLPDERQVTAWREAGELLLAYQTQVPPGASEVTVPDYDGLDRKIALDPTLTPVENAQAYFRRYEKARRAGAGIPARLENIARDLAFLEQMAADLALCESRPEIEAVREVLAEAGWARPPRRRSSAAGGPRRFEVDGYVIFVGRNARQNETITFRQAGPKDLWLHVRGQPGAHVLIKSGGRSVPEGVLQRAAALAAYYSPAGRAGGQVPVDVTERRFVRRHPGGSAERQPGLVLYRQERTLWVRGEP